MKNTVVLKDVESNLVEEAIIVFRDNVKIKEKQLAKGESSKQISDSENITMEEAQNVILNYIGSLENEKRYDMQQIRMRILKGVNIFLVFSLVIAIIF